MQSIDPTHGTLLSTFSEHSEREVSHHIEAASNAQSEWRETSIQHRASMTIRLADLLERDREKLATLMAHEMGKPIVQGRAEIDKCAWACRYYAEETESILEDLVLPTGRTKSYVTYQPLGVILAVMPWNFPFWQVIRFVAPALMAGNAAVLKHASNVMGSAAAIDDLIVEAGFPDGLFRSLLIPSGRVAAIIENPLIAAVTLTGSDAAGRAVAATAGQELKRTVLELGGSDPYLVLEDADLDVAVQACAFGRLLNAGQSCIAAKRFIVHESIVDEFTERLVTVMDAYVMGDPLDEGTELGPMARLDLRDELHDQVKRSLAAGAELRLGGHIPEGPGAFYPPTVVSNVSAGMAVYEEETFGPVAAIISVKDEDEAVAVANDSPFGLGGAVFTRDLRRGENIARNRIEAGSVFVNAFVASDPRLPFGGIKASGYGRELSHVGMHEFLNIKTIVIQ